MPPTPMTLSSLRASNDAYKSAERAVKQARVELSPADHLGLLDRLAALVECERMWAMMKLEGVAL